MKTKPKKTEEQEAAESGNYAPIYLVLNGNNITVNNYYLRTAIEEAHEYGTPLYVTSNAGSPKDPPPCPAGFPNCHG